MHFNGNFHFKLQMSIIINATFTVIKDSYTFQILLFQNYHKYQNRIPLEVVENYHFKVSFSKSEVFKHVNSGKKKIM